MTQSKIRELYEYRDGKLYWRVSRSVAKAGDEAGFVRGPGGRWGVMVDGKQVARSRAIWTYFYGEIPAGLLVDHINRDPTDDRLENLRVVSQQQNNQNRRKRSDAKTSQYIGVRLLSSITKKYEAAMAVGTKRIYLGIFEEAADAAQAYNFAVAQHKPAYGVYNGAENVFQEF